MSRNKDTDYLALSARIHAMEGRLLTRDRMDRMIDAREESEALKVLTECGYGGAEGLRARMWSVCWPPPGRRPFRS